jgi:hypothetical protein
MAIWAFTIAGTFCFSIFVLPKLPELRARADWLRAEEISAESDFYCEKWGMTRGTHEHTLCTFDLQEIRANVEKRFAADNDF